MNNPSYNTKVKAIKLSEFLPVGPFLSRRSSLSLLIILLIVEILEPVASDVLSIIDRWLSRGKLPFRCLNTLKIVALSPEVTGFLLILLA